MTSKKHYLTGPPYVDKNKIGGFGLYGASSYIFVAGVKEPRLKVIVAIVRAISDISKSLRMGFFKPKDEVKATKETYDKGEGKIVYLNFMPRALDEGSTSS